MFKTAEAQSQERVGVNTGNDLPQISVFSAVVKVRRTHQIPKQRSVDRVNRVKGDLHGVHRMGAAVVHPVAEKLFDVVQVSFDFVGPFVL